MRTRGVLFVAALTVLAACSSSGGDDGAAPPSTTVPPSPSEWRYPGGNLDNARSAEGSPWSVATVDGAEVAWEAELADVGSLSTVPIVVDGTAYVQGSRGVIVAVDLETGEERWRTEASGFNIGPFGVAVDGGRVFGVHGWSGIVAVDAETGEQVWQRDIAETGTTGVDIQPIVHDGLVLVSTVPVSIDGIYTPGDRGVLHALDVETGDDVWTWDTVEGDLWGHPEVNSGGGAWYPPAIDPEAGIVYFGIANPAPFPGTPEWPNATSRPGPNLYTNSLVALDVRTGELQWYVQVVPHDLLDRDQVMAMLARTDDGPVAISSGKSGIVVGIDPATGEERWRTEVGRHENDDLEALDGPTVVYPGTFGGVLTPPASAGGVVYLPVVNAPATLKPDETAYFGAAVGTEDGEVAAVDATTGELLWSTKVAGDPLGGVTVLNDLLLVPLLEGDLLGLDRATGEVVWEDRLPGGTNGQPAVAGELVLFPVGNAEVPKLVAYRVAA